MKICMIGTGYVGLVSGSCLADFGNWVTCVDIDTERIAFLRAGGIPIYEPGLKDMVERNVRSGRLTFTSDIAAGVAEAEVVFIAVGTPPQEDGSTDLSFVYAASEQIAKHLKGYTVVVQKSTVPVGTTRVLAGIITEHAAEGAEFDIVSNPEFLREGSAVEDFLRPNRVIIGVESERAAEIMTQVYGPLYLIETPIVTTTVESAELIKYASNAFLATKISFVNEIALLCELTGANIDDVAKGMGLDGRIGPKFLHAGLGFGGSCLPKDVSSLVHLSKSLGYDSRIVQAALEVNHSLVDRALDKLKSELPSVKGRIVALLGLSFKPNTDDLREAPALRLVEKLTADGAVVRAFDPAAMERFEATTPYDVELCKTSYEAATGADALMLVTEWNEFRQLDLERLQEVMRGNVFIDCRNVYEPGHMKESGFRYHSFGRGTTPRSS